MSPITKMTIVAAPLALAGIVAFAANKMEDDARPLAMAPISLSQAIASAEHHSGGKAAKAEFEHTKAGWAYNVEIVNGTKTVDVHVSSDTGTVISAEDDKTDQNDEQDEKD
jgi:uncharacterized membrane protein YkoI